MLRATRGGGGWLQGRGFLPRAQVHQGNKLPTEDPSKLLFSIPYSALIPSTDLDFALNPLLGPAGQPHGIL